MKSIETTDNNSSKFHSLSTGLVTCFILLSLIPLLTVSWISYQQANNSLSRENADKLEQSVLLNQRFILNWFEDRFRDISSQAENLKNPEFLSVLQKNWHLSDNNLAQYTKSYDWTSAVSNNESDLVSLQRNYNYIYDIFLIDNDGNILYTVARESDLGTNLFTGQYADSNFARIVKKTSETGLSLFSDLERYEPSNNLVSGFITAPILDELGDKQGVFAIQIYLSQVFSTLSMNVTSSQSLKYYLVGEDGRLRTPISNNENEVLNKKIDTDQFRKWKFQQTETESNNKSSEKVFTYVNSDGIEVIGLHSDVSLPGVNWVLIGEIETEEILSAIKLLRETMFLVVFLTIIIVILLAIYQARRISKPIIMLANVSGKVAAGELHHKVEVNSKNEIGQLAETFNQMLDARRISEQLLRSKNEETQLALAELADQKFALDQHAIVVITDVKGTISFANDKFSEITGYSHSELLGKNHRILNSGIHDEAFFRNMYRTIASGKVWKGEICNKAKAGELYWVDTTIVPFMGKDNKPVSYIAIRTDITANKLSAAALREALEVAETATRLKSDFLANMSHEIRTPMNGVIGMTGLLLDTSLTQKQRNYANNTMKSAEALLTIINDILDFSKIEAGKMELEKIPFDLQELAEDVSELMALKAREKNVEMLLRYRPDTQRLLIGDPGRIRQILLNLLSNAVKFTDQGNILLSIESHHAVDNVITIFIKIEDTGIGIDADKLDKIFNKFDQEDSSTTRKFGGTGLGLSICQQLCNLMQGDILVSSEKGVGSTFSFTMNLDVCHDEELITALPGDLSLLSELKVLVVDDLEIARTILNEQVSKYVSQVDMVSSGEAALKILFDAKEKNKPYDIVLIDHYMPEMNGESLAAEIKNRNLVGQLGSLFLVTSSPRNGNADQLMEQGYEGYLTKPTRPTEVPKLLALIRAAKIENRSIPLMTRHHLQSKVGSVSSKVQLRNTLILLAEDNPINQLVATEYLEGYGCTVTPAGNGLEALSLMNDMDFDLIFMDCQMPEMDGFQATQEIRKRESTSNKARIPIIAFTANAMQGDKENCLSAGMDDFISKPVGPNALIDILKKWLPDNIIVVEEAKEDDTVLIAEGTTQSIVEVDDSFDTENFDKLYDLFQEKYPEAVESHVDNLLDNLKKMHEAILNEDLAVIELVSHSIKGSSAQFGANELSLLAKEMEQMAKSDKLDQPLALYEKIMVSYQNVIELMRVRLNLLSDAS